MGKKKSDQNRWIVLVGGGTGGHVVPIKNIAEQIFSEEPGSKVLIVTNKGYLTRTEQIFSELLKSQSSNLEIRSVSGGRFRRYSRSKVRELLDIKTQALNIRDLFKSLYGVCQAKFILLKFKPSVIFCKGGTGALEFCFAARKKAPIVVHDSDSRPGLANKTVSRWAKRVLTGMPTSTTALESETMVGIPVSSEFKLVSDKHRKRIREELGLDQKSKTVLVTGGSLGAKRVNELIFCTIGDINALGIQVLHQTGSTETTKQAKEIRRQLKYPKLYRPFDFSPEMSKLYGASDVVVSRAGASAIQELANSSKPAILIPAGLTDQKKNGVIIEELGAALVADQTKLLEEPGEFISELQFLLNDENLRKSLIAQISKLARPDSRERIVREIFELRGER